MNKEARNRVGALIERYNDKIITYEEINSSFSKHFIKDRFLLLSVNVSNRDMSQAFDALFRDKIANIRNGLKSILIGDNEGVVSDTGEVTDVVCDSFRSVTVEQVMQVVAKLSSVTCEPCQYSLKCKN